MPGKSDNRTCGFWPDFHFSNAAGGTSIAPPAYRWFLCLAALITWPQHARMPLLILGVGITKPPLTHRAAYGRRVGAGRIGG
jgi:hypothetical protein